MSENTKVNAHLVKTNTRKVKIWEDLDELRTTNVTHKTTFLKGSDPSSSYSNFLRKFAPYPVGKKKHFEIGMRKNQMRAMCLLASPARLFPPFFKISFESPVLRSGETRFCKDYSPSILYAVHM